MDHESVGRYWEGNAETWTALARAGYDAYRDGFNTPAFLAMLPGIDGLAGLDVGCGEGHNTRLLAERGARMTGIDISPTFVRHAAAAEETHPLGIRYEVASALALPFEDAAFDFVTAFMSLMDMPETERVVAEAFRVLRPGEFFQFSIEHPCFNTPHHKTLRDDTGRAYAREVGDYFRRLSGEVQEWTFSTVPPDAREGLRPFRVPRFTHTLSEWLNLLLDAGFMLARFDEPRPDDASVRERPQLQSAQVVALFLHARVRKPSE
jgi:SAM-dependent methyltransferase